MPSEALEVIRPSALEVSQEHKKLARETIAKGLNDPEFALYLYDCQRQGVHPLDKLLIPVVQTVKGERKLNMWTTVDLLRSRAAETGEYAGNEDAMFEYAEGTKLPLSSTMTVWKIVQGQRCPFTATARWEEYYPGEDRGFMWRSKPHVMLGKCAEALALRKAFPKQLAGLYAEEEMHMDPEDTPAPVAAIQPPKLKTTTSPAPAVKQTGASEPASGGSATSQAPLTEKQLGLVCALQKKSGVSDDAFKAYLLETYKVQSRKDIPKAVVNDVIAWLDQNKTAVEGEVVEDF